MEVVSPCGRVSRLRPPTGKEARITVMVSSQVLSPLSRSSLDCFVGLPRMCEALDQRQPLDPVDERDRQTSIGGRFVVVFQSCVGRSASSNPRKGQQTLETLKDRDRNRHLGKQQGEMTGRSTARSTGRSRVEAWSAGEPVFFYGAPDCRRHCGVLRVGEVNCRHCSDIIGRNGAISKVAGWPRFELGGGDAGSIANVSARRAFPGCALRPRSAPTGERRRLALRRVAARPARLPATVRLAAVSCLPAW